MAGAIEQEIVVLDVDERLIQLTVDRARLVNIDGAQVELARCP